MATDIDLILMSRHCFGLAVSKDLLCNDFQCSHIPKESDIDKYVQLASGLLLIFGQSWLQNPQKSLTSKSLSVAKYLSISG